MASDPRVRARAARARLVLFNALHPDIDPADLDLAAEHAALEDDLAAALEAEAANRPTEIYA